MSARTILKISGGAGSWAAGRKWRDENPGATLELLFTDTLCEDQDTYRFLIAGASNLLGVALPAGFLPEIEDFPAWEGDGENRGAYKAYVLSLSLRCSLLMPGLHWISDGRDVFDVMLHERFLGSSRFDPCSKKLKREAGDRWLRENCDPADTVVLIGIGPDEEQRFLGDERFGRVGLAARMAARGWDYRAPLISGITSWFAHRVEAEVERAGLWVQRLYRLGFSHANCGGGCVKAGIRMWMRMMRAFPERYAFWERFEQRMTALLGVVSMMTDRRRTPDNPTGAKRPLTLVVLRNRALTDEDLLHNGGGGEGCRCATGDDSDLEDAA